jgi:hypothetical protein
MERLQSIIYKDAVFHLNEHSAIQKKRFDSFMSMLQNPARVSAIAIHIKNLVLNSYHGISDSELESILSSTLSLESLVLLASRSMNAQDDDRDKLNLKFLQSPQSFPRLRRLLYFLESDPGSIPNFLPSQTLLQNVTHLGILFTCETMHVHSEGFLKPFEVLQSTNLLYLAFNVMYAFERLDRAHAQNIVDSLQSILSQCPPSFKAMIVFADPEDILNLQRELLRRNTIKESRIVFGVSSMDFFAEDVGYDEVVYRATRSRSLLTDWCEDFHGQEGLSIWEQADNILKTRRVH